jgi:predicted nucleic acid-binding protein
MSYLLDTVVVSAMRRPRQNPASTAWLSRQDPLDLWISALTIGEIAQVIERAGDPQHRALLSEWLREVRALFEGHVIPFAGDEAEQWGRSYAPMEMAGKPPAVVDSMIAATALLHGFAVVTRNVRHFEPFDVPIINPWDDENGA